MVRQNFGCHFTLYEKRMEYYDEYMYRNAKGEPLTDDLQIVFLELTKLESLLGKPVEELSHVDMWAIFLRYASDKNKRDILNKIIN